LFNNRLMMAGIFPNEWWMRDFAGKVFAILSHYTEPPTWREARLMVGNDWRLLKAECCQYALEDSSRVIGNDIAIIEKLTVDRIGSMYFELVEETPSFYVTWTGWGANDKKYNLTDCLISVKNLFVYPRSGAHPFAHAELTYDAISIYAG